MSDGILKEVLQLEQQIEAELAREKIKTDSWLAETRRSIDREISCEQAQSDRDYEQQERDALRLAREQAAQILRDERHRARALITMPNDKLLPLLIRRLQVVLTGRDDDRSDDQS